MGIPTPHGFPNQFPNQFPKNFPTHTHSKPRLFLEKMLNIKYKNTEYLAEKVAPINECGIQFTILACMRHMWKVPYFMSPILKLSKLEPLFCEMLRILDSHLKLVSGRLFYVCGCARRQISISFSVFTNIQSSSFKLTYITFCNLLSYL